MTDTTTRPAVGDTVRAYDVPSYPQCEGQTVTITRDGTYWSARDKVGYYATFNDPDSDDEPIDLNFYDWRPSLIPAVGDKVLAYKIPLFSQYEGKVATVTAVSSNGKTVHGEFQSLEKPDDSINLAFEWWEPADGHTLTVSSPEGRIEALEEQIENLKRELTAAEALASRWETRVDNLQRENGEGHRAITIIGDRMIEEAENRSWCEEFDRITREVNDDLPSGWELRERRKPRVQITVRLKGETYKDVQVWVDEDNRHTTDPDEWYEDRDTDEDEALGDDWATEQLDSEYQNNGFDDTNYSIR